MAEYDVSGHVENIGTRVTEYWKHAAEHHELPVTFDGGYPCLAHFHFDHPKCEELRTLYTQLMLDRGYLASPSIYPTLAHSEEIVEAYGEAVNAVFKEISEIIAGDRIEKSLKGPVAHSGFKRLL